MLVDFARWVLSAAWSLSAFCSYGARLDHINNVAINFKHAFSGAESIVCLGGPGAVVAANHSGPSIGT